MLKPPQMRRMRASSTPAASATDRNDPLTQALLPPPNESPAAKSARLQQEKEAKARSDEIDRFLKANRDASSSSDNVGRGGKLKGRAYKMVLLGQAGAGKTTVLKQMRLLYDPEAHEKERSGWAKIVLLNLTSSVRMLLETMDRYLEDRRERKSVELIMQGGGERPLSLVEVDEEARKELAAEVGPKNEINTSAMPWAAHLPRLQQLEKAMRQELGAFGEEVVLGDSTHTASQRAKGGDRSPLQLRPGWQERLFTYARRSFSINNGAQAHRAEDLWESTSTFLSTIQDEVLAVWNDDPRCRALRKRGLFLDGQSDAATSYFLDHYARITAAGYAPSDDDILYSRVRTVGVTEDVFRVDRNLIYRIYDVGGSRSQRAAWVPFLDDVESIIFLAPLSAFDQPLVEDPTTNRLADTFALFNQVVSNPLLRNASMILFLNKIDLLEKKLKAGVKLGRYWVEYSGDNDFEAVWRWFRAKFRDALRRAEDEARIEEHKRRRLYVHTTVATSTKQIRAILMSVKDSVLRENLRITGLVG